MKENRDSHNNIFVSHFVGLSGVGGVQRNFVEYINNRATLEGDVFHKVYTLGEVDLQYKMSIKIYDIRELKNLFALIVDIVSRNKIVHFYNNLTSLKVAILLFLLPVRNLIMHERGTIWNFPSSRKLLLRFISWKAHLILANSNATKIMLEKKFSVPNGKIRVLHNGINTEVKCTKFFLVKDRYPVFRVGFIGRLDTPKGVHVLIHAMKHLINNKINLVIAGDGALMGALKNQADGLASVSFIGRVSDPYKFFSNIDLLVVPSIREPLGNVCLEAGLCKTPVLAANVDGIAEIIENKVSGELINATDEVSINLLEGAAPLPELVVNSVTKKLVTPKQINPSLLASKILELSSKPEQLLYYVDNLYYNVKINFSMNRYIKELHKIYYELSIF